MPTKESCSPLNNQKLPPPAPNARSLRTVNPPSCHPSVRGAPAPDRSAPITLPVAK
jgi:hypothetical protein